MQPSQLGIVEAPDRVEFPQQVARLRARADHVLVIAPPLDPRHARRQRRLAGTSWSTYQQWSPGRHSDSDGEFGLVVIDIPPPVTPIAGRGGSACVSVRTGRQRRVEFDVYRRWRAHATVLIWGPI